MLEKITSFKLANNAELVRKVISSSMAAFAFVVMFRVTLKLLSWLVTYPSLFVLAQATIAAIAVGSAVLVFGLVYNSIQIVEDNDDGYNERMTQFNG